MPEKIDFTNALTAEGTFTADFLAQLPTLAGDEHKDTKAFDNIKSVPTLVKAYADSMSLRGKRLENVIQKPAEDASDEQKAEYRTQLLTALSGGVEKAEEYALTAKPEDWPEGLPFDAKLMEEYQNFFLEKKWPVGMAQELVSKYHEILLQRVDEQLKAEEKLFNEQVDARKADWKGDALTKNTRTAAKAVLQFASTELKELVQKEKLLDTPTDFDKWRNVFISPDQVAVWYNIGKAMRSDEHVGDEGGGHETGGSDKKKAYEKVYDHPTSKVLTDNIA